MQDVIDILDGDGKTSMLQDIENKRKTEVDYFAGTLIKIAEENGIKVPVNEVLYSFIKAKEKNY